MYLILFALAPLVFSLAGYLLPLAGLPQSYQLVVMAVLTVLAGCTSRVYHVLGIKLDRPLLSAMLFAMVPWGGYALTLPLGIWISFVMIAYYVIVTSLTGEIFMALHRRHKAKES